MISTQKSTKLPHGPSLLTAPLYLFPDYNIDKWDIPESDIVLGEQIGSGFFGTVYKGNVQRNLGESGTNGTDKERRTSLGCIVVAVKMLKGK